MTRLCGFFPSLNLSGLSSSLFHVHTLQKGPHSMVVLRYLTIRSPLELAKQFGKRHAARHYPFTMGRARVSQGMGQQTGAAAVH